MPAPSPYPYTKTDLEGWRLLVSEDSHGQHKWAYLQEDDPRRESWKQTDAAKYWLGLKIVRDFQTGTAEIM